MQNRIYIWGKNIPYNTGEDKLSKMKYAKHTTAFMDLVRCGFFLGNKTFKPTQKYQDTLTYSWEIKPGRVNTTFTDQPYLLPFIVPGSDRAVIVNPGGAFSARMDEAEGINIAKKLNADGISAFVLYYRLNPYKFPVPFLDMQRAIRYLRYHAADFGIHPDKIGTLGFSAGGYLAESAAVVVRGQAVEYPGYEPDEIDYEDDRLAFVGLMYTPVDFRYSPCGLFSMYPLDQVMDDAMRPKLIEKACLTNYLTPDAPPHFVCYGTKDDLAHPDCIGPFLKALEDNQISTEILVMQGVGHGFVGNKKCAHWYDTFVTWAQQQFAK